MDIKLLEKSLDVLQFVYNENEGENDITEVICTLISDQFLNSAEIYTFIKNWLDGRICMSADKIALIINIIL